MVAFYPFNIFSLPSIETRFVVVVVAVASGAHLAFSINWTNESFISVIIQPLCEMVQTTFVIIDGWNMCEIKCELEHKLSLFFTIFPFATMPNAVNTKWMQASHTLLRSGGCDDVVVQ